MLPELTESVKETIRSAARKLTGFVRRQFQAEVALKYCQGKAREAEKQFGWGRVAVATGLFELRTGIRCLDNYAARGRRRTETQHPELVERIQALVDPQSQADPQLKTTFAYTRITAKAVREKLAADAAGTDHYLPAERTLSTILNRLGYRLRRVRKTRPKKKCLKPTPSSSTCMKSTPKPPKTRRPCASRSTPKPR